MGISIQIKAGSSAATSRADVSGWVQHVLTDQERQTFGVYDEQLKQAVAAYFGARPDDAFVVSPTPWSDLYKRYGWPQATMTLTAQHAQIIGMDAKPIIVKTQEFDNTSAHPATFNVSITDAVTNEISSSWSSGGSLTISESVEVGAELEGIGVKSTTSMSYTDSWGKGGGKSSSSTIGSDSGLSVALDPGQGVLAELTASRGTLTVRVTYVGAVSGHTAVNYGGTFKGHHFWGLDLPSVMRAAGLPTEVTTTQDIVIDYYSDSKVELKDRATGNVQDVHRMIDLAGVSQTVTA